MKRYQECSPIIKLWRKRWYFVVPFLAVWMWVTSRKVTDDDTGEETPMPFWLCWRCAVGEMQVDKMKFYHTSDEVFENIKKKFKK